MSRAELRYNEPMRQGESGNVFVYIFVCIALLAALSYAVAQGGRSSVTSLTEERQRLLATDIIGYSDSVSKAVSLLRLRGTPMNSISFANPFVSAGEYGDYNDDPANEIFNPAGGAVVYTDPPAEATTTGTEEYLFLANNEISGIGTTCGNANCSDLLIAIDNMRKDVCMKINDLLGVQNPPDGDGNAAPPNDTNIDEATKFLPATNFGYTATIGDEDSALADKREACFYEGNSKHTYYRVLLGR